MSFRNGRPVANNSTSLQLNDVLPAGTLIDFGGISAPAGFFLCDGTAVSRTTYANLFANIVTANGFTAQTFTVTIANPAVVTKTAHGFNGGERIRLFTTGALPTGLDTTTDYYVVYINANTFNLISSIGNSNIVTTGSQSGTHTYLRSLYGLGDGSTTFNLPNFIGRSAVGPGTYFDPVSGAIVRNIGQHIGTDAHTLTSAQSGVPAHTHVATDAGHVHGVLPFKAGASYNGGTTFPSNTAGTSGTFDTNLGVANITVNNNITANAASSHNNMQPSLVVTKIIKY